MQEGASYSDGGHVWVAIPQLGNLEYHPFSVASTSADPAWRNCMLLHCKAFDRWTQVRHTCPCMCVTKGVLLLP
jgi:hypothetical protein